MGYLILTANLYYFKKTSRKFFLREAEILLRALLGLHDSQSYALRINDLHHYVAAYATQYAADHLLWAKRLSFLNSSTAGVWRLLTSMR